nr:MAG TPA: hypothetical protein [Caudoviricetes sp.]
MRSHVTAVAGGRRNGSSRTGRSRPRSRSSATRNCRARWGVPVSRAR